MDEFLDILREEKVKELIEETARFYYTSPATTVNLLLPIALSGLFLLGENIKSSLETLSNISFSVVVGFTLTLSNISFQLWSVTVGF